MKNHFKLIFFAFLVLEACNNQAPHSAENSPRKNTDSLVKVIQGLTNHWLNTPINFYYNLGLCRTKEQVDTELKKRIRSFRIPERTFTMISSHTVSSCDSMIYETLDFTTDSINPIKKMTLISWPTLYHDYFYTADSTGHPQKTNETISPSKLQSLRIEKIKTPFVTEYTFKDSIMEYVQIDKQDLQIRDRKVFPGLEPISYILGKFSEKCRKCNK